MEPEALSLITAAAAGLTNGVVSGVTLYFPGRSKGTAFLLALVSGVILAGLAAAAYLPPGATFDRQVVAQVVIVGMGAGLAAAGLSVSQASAEARRQAVAPSRTEPDPMHPDSRVAP